MSLIPKAAIAAAFVLAASQGMQAQESLLYADSHSPLEDDYQATHLHPAQTLRDAVLSNPAMLCSSLGEHRLFTADNPHTAPKIYPFAVAVNGATGRMRGDFIPTEGNSFDDASVVASGTFRKNRSLLLGKASFTTGAHRNIGWNVLRSPQTYWPYIVADSTGGNMGYETYNLLLAYSTRLSRRTDFGLSGEYKGDFAYRQTDPRIEDITSWLTLKGGVACQLNDSSRLAVDISYELHRQHNEVKHFRSGQFAGFFMEYGFGMFDYIHSPIYNSMKNMQHQHSYGTSLQYLSSAFKPLRLNARLAYRMDEMNSEENIYKLNLYRARTHNLSANFAALRSGKHWGFACYANATLARRKGREYIFERYVSDQVDGVNIYDYRKIGHNDRYTLSQLSADAQLKLSRYIGHTATLSLIGAVNYFSREEKYTENGYNWKNALVTPQVGIEAAHRGKSAEGRLAVRYGRRTTASHRYHVTVDLDRHTEYQHAFSPYAYYCHEGHEVAIEAEAAHTFPKLRLGLLAQALIVRANRLDNVTYSAERYTESVPSARKHTVSLNPDAHNQHWAKITIFAEF